MNRGMCRQKPLIQSISMVQSKLFNDWNPIDLTRSNSSLFLSAAAHDWRNLQAILEYLTQVNLKQNPSMTRVYGHTRHSVAGIYSSTYSGSNSLGTQLIPCQLPFMTGTKFDSDCINDFLPQYLLDWGIAGHVMGAESWGWCGISPGINQVDPEPFTLPWHDFIFISQAQPQAIFPIFTRFFQDDFIFSSRAGASGECRWDKALRRFGGGRVERDDFIFGA